MPPFNKSTRGTTTFKGPFPSRHTGSGGINGGVGSNTKTRKGCPAASRITKIKPRKNK